MRNLLPILAYIFTLSLFAQELPPVLNFGPNDYSGGNQNWMISQSEGNLYFANSTGLLEYNGEAWKVYPVPNRTIVRAAKAVGNRIYTGAYMEAGYWSRDDFGDLVYKSLIPEFPQPIMDGEQFWEIEFLDEMVVFRSFNGIYFYDPGANTITQMDNPPQKIYTGLFKLNNELYFQQSEAGLFRIRNGEQSNVIPYQVLGDRAIIHIFEKEGELNLVTGNSEFYSWNGTELNQIFPDLNREIGNPNILSAISLPDGSVILGTVGNGVLQVGPDGRLVNSFNQANIMINNTILDIFQDESGNIWAGLDYGLAMIDLDSGFRSFQDNRGEIGSVYSSLEYGGNLYLGTNQGLYVKKQNSQQFKLIEETKGQVWFIGEIDGRVYCGHNQGTFLIEGESAKKIVDRLGTWLVKPYAENILIQGHYNGISFLKIENGKITVLPMLEEFAHSSKFIEVDEARNVWVSNEHKGIFKMRLQDSLSLPPKEIQNYRIGSESGITSSIFKYDNSLYYSTTSHIYEYQDEKDDFTKDNLLDSIVSGIDRVSGKMISFGEGTQLWGFSQEGIFYIEPAVLNRDYKLDFIYLDQDFRNIAIGYENLSSFGKSEYLLGVANGYIRFEFPVKQDVPASINIDNIQASIRDSVPKPVSLEETGKFAYNRNNISFFYSVPVHQKYMGALYSHRLLGFSPNWSSWAKESNASFKNLNPGDYTFEVKAKIGDRITEPVRYEFRVERPFYLSNTAIFLYGLGLVLILLGIHFLYRRYHKKMIVENERVLRMKNLEAEKEIIRLRNEKLEQDMANKNRELAVSTMSLIKKNEFLSSIKDKLKKSGEEARVKSVIQTIDRDISEEDNWKFFKRAFSNADKDFFKKVKARHPELTSNDLKLCAYLRLNLSSKEIAPLLNISVKSVEIKRYRLRKKMELDRDTNLTEYILSL
ncbi:histidine kinase [Gramella sp. GC03-9]|uniref:Histidine kinase n=1 Tax=Christiangramia oceanisediminis TaxID=2920386 RepID=A0A9X2I994_9FLAO|nr:triple tyrosine motif-containing protein [Gramella oceanisediminis]MCP9199058.1 histidine kinase [Gramella oceanisediminis]